MRIHEKLSEVKLDELLEPGKLFAFKYKCSIYVLFIDYLRLRGATKTVMKKARTLTTFGKFAVSFG